MKMKMNKKKKEEFNQYKAMQMQTKNAQRKLKKDPLKSRGIKYVDYKDVRILSKFVNDQGKVLPSRITGVTSKMQREVNSAIKRARHLGLMPYVTDEYKS